VESNSPPTAQEQLDALATGREQMLERIAMSARESVAYAVVMNACMVALVAPTFLSWGWTMLVQAACLVGMVVLAAKQGGRERVKWPKLRVPGARAVSALALLTLLAALVMGIYARTHDNPWLGAAALLVNFAGYLVIYGGMGFLLRRQYSRLG